MYNQFRKLLCGYERVQSNKTTICVSKIQYYKQEVYQISDLSYKTITKILYILSHFSYYV